MKEEIYMKNLKINKEKVISESLYFSNLYTSMVVVGVFAQPNITKEIKSKYIFVIFHPLVLFLHTLVYNNQRPYKNFAIYFSLVLLSKRTNNLLNAW